MEVVVVVEVILIVVVVGRNELVELVVTGIAELEIVTTTGISFPQPPSVSVQHALSALQNPPTLIVEICRQGWMVNLDVSIVAVFITH